MIDRSRVKEVTEAATQGRYPKVSDGWCPRCTKLVASVVAVGAEHWLFSPGGRVGSTASMVAEWRRNLAEAEEDVELYRRLGNQDGLRQAEESAEVFRRIEIKWIQEGWPAWTPPQAQPLDLARLPTRLSAPCRGCRADVWVEVHADWRVEVLDRVHHWDNMST